MRDTFKTFLKNRPKKETCNHAKYEWCNHCIRVGRLDKVSVTLPDGQISEGYVISNI